MKETFEYTDDSIKTLEWQEHIRRRPGMYIGKLGDGSASDDGIYVLIKEVMDNSIDEYMMGFGDKIELKIDFETTSIEIRDYGRGIPLNKLVDASSKMNTGGKYDSKAFKRSVGLNGVGIKAVNALSSNFKIISTRENEFKSVIYSRAKIVTEDSGENREKNGTYVCFTADKEIFPILDIKYEYVESLLKNYTYLNPGLLITCNGNEYISKRGLSELLEENIGDPPLYPVIQLSDDDLVLAITHTTSYGENYFTFVNGQNTVQGGTHLLAFKEAYAKTIREFFKKEFDVLDIRASIFVAVAIRVEEPVFESQTKTKLGSKDIAPNGRSIRAVLSDFLKENLDNYLHQHPDVAEVILKKILDAERERKEISGIQKLAKDRAKKVSLHNRKLRDCKVHYNDIKNPKSKDTMLFITEGDSASGSITKSRDVMVQAVFSLKGKPKSAFGETRKIIYENEEFNLLQAALNIEDDLENLRYNKVIIATDADVDGMHIRLLMITFFLQFFPDLVRNKHLYILQTPLFRVRNKKETIYCYNDNERQHAEKKLKTGIEITRFKGLGEISPDEFRHFIGENIRIDPVIVSKEDSIHDLLSFYMGDNTMQRQNFIIENLKIEEDI